MELNTEIASSGSSIEALPAGVYDAVVVKIVELGAQPPHPDFAVDDKGKPKGPKSVLAFTFEIPDESIEINGENKPRVVFKNITVSLGPKSHLSKIVAGAGLSGKFNTKQLLGTAVTLTMGFNQARTKIVPIAFAPMTKRGASAVPEPQSALSYFSFAAPDLTMFKSLPDWQQESIQSAANFKGSLVEKMLFDSVPSEDSNISDVDVGDAF